MVHFYYYYHLCLSPLDMVYFLLVVKTLVTLVYQVNDVGARLPNTGKNLEKQLRRKLRFLHPKKKLGNGHFITIPCHADVALAGAELIKWKITLCFVTPKDTEMQPSCITTNFLSRYSLEFDASKM